MLVEAMSAEGVKRLIAISNVGVGDSAAALPWIVKKVVFPLFVPFLVKVLEDKEHMEAIIMRSGLNWTIVRYNGIVGDEPKGTRRVALDGRVGILITAPDAARFLVEQLDDRTYVGRAPSVSN